MPSLLERVENALGGAFSSYRGHDDKLFFKSPGFKAHPNPTIIVTSPECGESTSELRIHHTPLGENRFPRLKWSPPALTEDHTQSAILEYLIIVEDPDAPLPMPITHGIYYGIPAGKTQLTSEDFAAVSGSQNDLSGGFKYGLNRRKVVWSGPKPVLGHGQHRYMFQVVGLSSSMEKEALSKVPTRAELEKAVEGKVVGWGMWVGTYERKLT